jgi:DNA-binding transcriptional LysR family regulator
VSRPAISKSIAQLESEIGLPLFYRNADGVYLTDTAQALYPRIQKVVEEFDLLESEMQQLKGNAQAVRIGFCNSSYPIFMDQIQEFSQKYPDIPLKLVQYQHEDPLSELKNGQVDLVLSGSSFSDETLVRQPAYRGQLLWGVPSDSPMGQRGFITDEEIRSHTVCLTHGSHNVTVANHPVRQGNSQLPIAGKAEQPAADLPFSSCILDDDMFYLCKLVLRGKAILPISEKLIPAKIEGISFVPCPEHPYCWQVDLYYSRSHRLKKGANTLIKEVFNTPPSEDSVPKTEDLFQKEVLYAIG